jgi:hypothetical protein
VRDIRSGLWDEELIVLVLVNQNRSFCGPPRLCRRTEQRCRSCQIEKSFWWSMTTLAC